MQIVTKEQAMQIDQKWYFTGVKCKNGHIDKRYVGTDICYECKRSQNKRWSRSGSPAIKEIQQRTYRKNSDKHRRRSREWAQKNVEKSRQIKQAYRLRNLEKCRQSARARIKQKRNSDVFFRLNRNISKEIWAALRGCKQGRTFKSFLSYNIEDIKKHLESQFSDEMCWQNYGKLWEIDHIIPLSHFYECNSIDDAVKKAWDIANLQPLEKHLNRSKQDRNTFKRQEILNELHKISS